VRVPRAARACLPLLLLPLAGAPGPAAAQATEGGARRQSAAPDQSLVVRPPGPR